MWSLSLGSLLHILLSHFFVSTASVPFSLTGHYKNVQEKKREAVHYVIFSLTTETARTNHTLVMNISLLYSAFQKCSRPTRPFLESIIKGTYKLSSLQSSTCVVQKSAVFSPHVYTKRIEFWPFHYSWKVYHDVH
jgi:hypothetical protein